jgi:Flp pilus assembly pilin Flp
LIERRRKMNTIKRLIQEEDGIGVVEVILILVVLIALVALFKNQLTDLVKNILDKVTRNANAI